MKMFVINFVTISLIFFLGTIGEAVRNEDLVLYLPFDAGTGNIAKDLSEHNNDGTLHKAKWAVGKYGNAIELSGEQGGGVEVSDAPSLDIADEITLMAWVYPQQFTDEWIRIIAKAWASDAAPWMVYGLYQQAGTNGKAHFSIAVNGEEKSTRAGTVPQLPLNQWTHLATTYGGSQIKLYYNGELKVEAAVTGQIDTNDVPVSVGRNSVGNREHYVGRIDDVAIWNAALNTSEIKQAMNGEISEKPGVSLVAGVPTQVLQNDEFDGTDQGLQTFWYVQNGDQSPHTLKDGYLVVEGAFNQNLWIIDNSTRFYQVTSQEQFTVETSMIFDHKDVCSIAGLVIKSATTKDTQGRDGEWVLLKMWGTGVVDQDGNTWGFREGKPFFGPGPLPVQTAFLQFQHRAREIIFKHPDYNPNQGNIPVQMRLERDGDNYEAWFKPSMAGEWVSVGKTTVALQGPLQVGLYIGICQPEAPGHLTVSFDYFRVSPSVAEKEPLHATETPSLETGKLYWTTNDKIQRADLDGSNIQEIVTDKKNLRGITVDSIDEKIYWTVAWTLNTDVVPKIQTADLDGSDIQDLVERVGNAQGIAVDSDGNKMYWTRGEKIQTASLDGMNTQSLITSGLHTPQSIALDITNNKVYWTASRLNKIQRADLDGSNIQDVVEDVETPYGIALDVAANKMYWTARGTSVIQCANLDGSNIQDVVTDVNKPGSIAVDVEGRKIYWTEYEFVGILDRGVGKIRRADLNGSNVKDVVTGLGTIYSIALGIPQATAPTTTDEPDDVYSTSDVNKDGQTDALDVCLVAAALWQTSPNNPRTDVNGDGIVDAKDVILVAENLDAPQVPAAPLSVRSSRGVTPETIQRILNLLRAANNGSLVFQEGIANLERLLASIIPRETGLLANYPNPFNPETWIPYQLAKPADVTVSIYSVDGSLIQTLLLGYQAAGIYQSRSRAAYWDGKNAVGEPVASGVYFYTLTAGDFTATRKMLIRK